MLSLCPSIGGCESSSTSTYVPAAPVPAQKAVDQDPKLPPIKTGREAKAPAPEKKSPATVTMVSPSPGDSFTAKGSGTGSNNNSFTDTPTSRGKGKANRRRASILTGEGETDAVVDDDQHEEESKDVRASIKFSSSAAALGESKLEYVYEMTVNAGFDPVYADTHKECQDTGMVFEVFENTTTGMACVLDGHGRNGRSASRRVRARLPELISKQRKIKNRSFKDAMRNAYEEAEEDLKKQSFDCRLSGTTGTTVFLTADSYDVSWVGDSRAVLVRSAGIIGGRREVRAEDASVDHKPNDLKEKLRIRRQGGQVMRVDAQLQPDPESPWRVFYKNTPEKGPAIAMSRSIGDTAATELGVWPKPSHRKIKATKDDMYMILASDGLWEVFSSQEAAEWCADYLADNIDTKSKEIPGFRASDDTLPVSQALADEAQRRWVQLYPEDMVDDCTIIVVHLKPPKANTLGRAGRRRSSILIDNADHVRLEAGAKKTSEEKAE